MFLFSSQLFNGHYFKEWSESEHLNLKEKQTGIICYIGLARQKNYPLCIRIISGMTFKFEHLGKFEIIFKNILRYEFSGPDGSILKKKQM
jgi:hypothetical protein